MKEFKGTKGPWRVSEKRGDMIDIRHGDNSIGAMSLNLARVTARQCWASEAEANAKLIAASPDLLEALQEVLYELSTAREVHDGTIRQADAAIAKALGETK